ncbi:MAG TPA: dihydrodipicolinate reductase [Anaeromyxobacteraceae bacterium]|nr:dihydrodipicolinate reductase [Anaeromyxobacteraceae bacterium]
MASEATGIPVVVAGLGEVGRAVARAALASADLRVVGAVDPAHAGRKLDALLGTPTGLEVEADPARALRAADGGVLLLATGSRFLEVLPSIEQAVRAGVSVVSTCEELAYPWLAHEPEADRLDALCERNDVAVVGTGVNPGLALDRLPALLSQGTGEVRRLEARRVVDLSGRRQSLWVKCGVGLSPEAFSRAVEAEAVGHVGLAESATLAALGAGLDLDELEEEAEPVLADRDLPGPVPLARGAVAGIRQVARGWQDGREVVRLEVVLAVGAADPRDEVILAADPPLRLVVPGGFPGEASTAWSVVHAASAVPMLQGLVTVLDLPPGRS